MIRLAAASALLLAASCATAQDVYEIDPVHSQPMFAVAHFGFSIQHGSFGRQTGKVTLDRVARKGTIEITIDTASIKTYDPRLDTHMKGEDFFNVVKYPVMTFRSTNLIFDGDRVVGAEGELTMIGVTRPVSLKVANFTCGDSPLTGRPMCGAEVTTTIRRSEWGMKHDLPTVVGDEVKITAPIEAYKQ